MEKNTRWYKSIRFKLIIPIVLVFVALSLMSTTILTRETIRTTEQILSELRQEIVLRVTTSLDDKLEQAVKLNEFHANALNNQILNLEDPSNRESYFSAALKPYDDVAMTYIGLPDGSFYGARRLQNHTLQIVRNNEETSGNSEYYDIDSNGNSTTLAQVFENFDARTRPWYQTALEKKQRSFSPLYSHFVFKVPTITASLPYYENEELVGVFGVDFLMTWLADTLGEISVGDHGTVFIVNTNNQLVASSNKEEVFKLIDGKAINIEASDSNTPVIREAINSIFSNSQSSSIDLEGKSYIVGRDLLDSYGLNWVVYTIIDKEDYTASLNSTITRMYSLVLLVSLLFLFFIVYSNHKFAEPILALNTHAKMLTMGSFEPVKPFKHSPEMTLLINSFNEMGLKVDSYVGDLQKEVQKQTKMYEEAAAEAQSANIAKSRFLATMSHELRTPLSGILGMVELLKMTALSDEQRDYVSLAEHTSQTLLHLINDVLDYSKIEAQQVIIESLPFELDHLRRDIEALSRLYVQSEKIKFKYIIDSAVPSQMIGDLFRIKQILTNLIGNAVNFTKKGEISISVELADLDPIDHMAFIRFSVTDTGVGIPLDRQELIFKPFSQADTSTTREYGGTGLGLSICKDLVELMDGTITLESTLGIGSKFSFTCKVGYIDNHATSKGFESAHSLGSDTQKDWIREVLSKPLGILLSEDSKVNYVYIEGIARKSNWHLFYAKNGEQAVEKFIEHRENIDVILMDLEMPILDGYEATRQIRAIEKKESYSPTHILAISANVLAGEREKCIEAGMDDYLVKPFRIEQLLAHICDCKK